MYSKSITALKYLRYLLSSGHGKGHGIHSPFIFEFITRVLNDTATYEAYAVAEGLRRKLLKDTRWIEVKDLGAGSVVSGNPNRRIASIARYAAKPKKFGQLLFRMVRHYKPATIIELGTSLGITTTYLALANPSATLYTLEGAPSITRVAAENFRLLQTGKPVLVEGNFDDTLPPLLGSISKLDLAFIDGNHRRLPTEGYFHSLLSKTHQGSILVLDDIHWSREMEQAWETVKSHPSVTCTIDLFFIGIVFFRSEFHEKQHFTIRF